MPTLTLTLGLDADGEALKDGPLVRQVSAPVAQRFSYTIQPAGGITVLPFLSQMQHLAALVFTASTASTLFLNGQSGEGVPLRAGAVVGFLDLQDCDGFPLWALLNASDDECRVRGVLLGTP